MSGARSESPEPRARLSLPGAPLSLICLAGPTAVGKSEVALHLAEDLEGEIVSVDSMQVYRGLDIGTAKPGFEERRRVRHHLIDVVQLTEPFDAARFVQLANRALGEIRERGRQPILCGGTGLYFKSLLEGLGAAPPGDPRLRAELEAKALPQLLAELESKDPATFARIDRQNPRRVVRALEVVRLTGKPFSGLRFGWEPPFEKQHPESGVRFFGFVRESSDLRARIDRRVDRMFASGLVEETRRLLEHGLEQSRTAMQAIGYRQVVEHLRGERSLADTVALVKQKTWQFARRQMTWFRHQTPVQWLALEAEEEAGHTSARLRALLETGQR
jgi:tRNA dimethylallyltransferase